MCYYGNHILEHFVILSKVYYHSLVAPVDVVAMSRWCVCVVYLGHTGHASDQQHLSDVSFGHLSVLHGLLAGGHGAADQVGHDTFELGTGQLHVEMFGAGGVHGQVGEVDVGLGRR